MANTTINQSEILHIRTRILGRVCHAYGLGYIEFESQLTGTLKYYEQICDLIQQAILSADICTYTDFLSDSPTKQYFKKYLVDSDEKKTLQRIAGFVSPNVLRKLIFNGIHEKEQTYKEDFIRACYLYLNLDRLDFLKSERNLLSDDSEFNEDIKNKITTLPLILDQLTPSFKLKPLKERADTLDEEKPILSFEGQDIALSRDNIESGNNTLTSRVQASFYFKDGSWFLENQSQYKTTLIQVTRPLEIQKGDIVILGNRRFIFDS